MTVSPPPSGVSNIKCGGRAVSDGGIACGAQLIFILYLSTVLIWTNCSSQHQRHEQHFTTILLGLIYWDTWSHLSSGRWLASISSNSLHGPITGHETNVIQVSRNIRPNRIVVMLWIHSSEYVNRERTILSVGVCPHPESFRSQSHPAPLNGTGPKG